MRSIPALALLIAGFLPWIEAHSQDVQPGQPQPLERLLADVRERLAAKSQEFERDLDEALRIFRSNAPSRRLQVKEWSRRLAPWVGVFPGRFAQVVAREKSVLARGRVLEVIAASRTRQVAPPLAALLVEPDVAANASLMAGIIDCLGRVGAPSAGRVIRNLLNGSPAREVRAAAILALARLHHPDAADLVRKGLSDEQTVVRRSAIRAAAILGEKVPGLADHLLRRLAEEKDASLEPLILRSLGAFPDDHDVRRALHKALGSTSESVLEAALDALARVGRKATSQRQLLALIAREEEVPAAIRKRAARMLLGWGSMAGVKAFVRKQKSVADKNPRNAVLQEALADTYRDLGAFEEALTYYKRALREARIKSGILVSMARCHARLGRFSKAKKALRSAGYTDFSPFADDPDFQQMRRDPDYADLFGA